MEMIRKSVIC